jgi:hypothetical protein
MMPISLMWVSVGEWSVLSLGLYAAGIGCRGVSVTWMVGTPGSNPKTHESQADRQHQNVCGAMDPLHRHQRKILVSTAPAKP